MDASSHAAGHRDPFMNSEHHFSGLDARTVATLVTQASDIALVIEDGYVRDVAVAPEDLKKSGFGENWIGQPWIDTVTPDSRTKVEALLNPGESGAPPRARQVNHPADGVRDVPIAYKTVRAGPRNALIALGRDLREAAELQQRLVKAQQDLERDYARLRLAEARYRMIFDIVSEPILIADAGDLMVEAANKAADSVLGIEPGEGAGRDLPSLFAPRMARPLERFAARALASGTSSADGLELASGGKIGLKADVFGQGLQARLIVRLIGSDQSSQAPSKQRLAVLEALEALPDGLIVTDSDLRILAANRAFLEMAHIAASEQVLGAALSSFVGRSSTDLNVLVSSLRANGSARNFATVLRDRFGAEEQVEVSAVSATSSAHSYFAFSVRLVARRISLDPPISQELPRSVDHLTNLVGRMPLKDIVRDATALIERLCIEAALSLTSDNRASAAEILGLSRQGLYSKLKRFGFDDKG